MSKEDYYIRFFTWVLEFEKKHGRLPTGYIAGPMTLYKDLAKDNPMRWGRYAFETCAKRLRDMFPGIDLFVPIEQDDKEGGPDIVFTRHTWEEVLAKDLAVLKNRDFVMLLPSWTESDGATLEANEGQRRGKALFRCIMDRPTMPNDQGGPLIPEFSDQLPPMVIVHRMEEPTFHGHAEGGIPWTFCPRTKAGGGLPPAMKLTKELCEQTRDILSRKPDDLMKPTNPKDLVSTDRLDLTLFPQTAICYGALAMAEGHMKYGGYNYRPGGVLASVYVAALMRHVFKWYNGEEEDPTTQVPHLANAMACLGVLVDAVECGTLKDDRPPHAVDMEDLFERMRKKVKFLQGKLPCDKPRYTQKTNPMEPKRKA